MSETEHVAPRVRHYLAELPRASRETLFVGLERARLRGTLDPVGAFLIEQLRAVVTSLGEDIPRVPTASRLFFLPIEMFLIDDVLPTKISGRIARSSLQRIWTWLENDAAQREVAAFDEAISIPMESDADELYTLADVHRRTILRRALERMEAVAESSDRLRKLRARVGGDRVYADLEDMLAILEHHAEFQDIVATLPDRIEPTDEDHVSLVNAALNRAIACADGLAGPLTIVLRGRMDPTKLADLAVQVAGTDDVRTLAGAPIGRLVDVMLSDIEWVAERAGRELADQHESDAIPHLREYFAASRRLRAAVDLETQPSAWARKLTEIRSRLSAHLSRSLGELFQTLRSASRPTLPQGRSPVMPMPGDTARAVALIGLLDVSRLAVGELAVNELVARAYSDALAYVDQTTALITEELRSVQGERRDIVVANAAAMVRLQEALHGHSQASLVRRGFEVAAGGALPQVRAAVA